MKSINLISTTPQGRELVALSCVAIDFRVGDCPWWPLTNHPSYLAACRRHRRRRRHYGGLRTWLFNEKVITIANLLLLPTGPEAEHKETNFKAEQKNKRFHVSICSNSKGARMETPKTCSCACDIFEMEYYIC